MTQNNSQQIDYWNGRAGQKWAAMQTSLDLMLANATAKLISTVGLVSGLNILDVGCGTGETCMIWLEGKATVTGVDVSEPMLEVAKKRTGGHARLVCADASSWTDDQAYDLVVSRFGVMFFEDPLQAFKSISKLVKKGGRMIFVCWRSSIENEWVQVPLNAARDLIPDLAPVSPNAPGPFALADRIRLGQILTQSGFTHISIKPFDFKVCFASEGGASAAGKFAMQIGPTGAAFAEARSEIRAQAEHLIATSLITYDVEGQVFLGGAAWIVEAKLES